MSRVRREEKPFAQTRYSRWTLSTLGSLILAAFLLGLILVLTRLHTADINQDFSRSLQLGRKSAANGATKDMFTTPDLGSIATKQRGMQLARSARHSSVTTVGSLVGTQADFCDQHFGAKWLRDWNETAAELCGRRQFPAGLASSLFCRRMDVDDHMSAASRPHILCNARNLLLDTSKAYRATCPEHRPGYLCKSRTYHRYQKGAFSLACKSIGVKLEQFPKDHLRDIMQSMESFKEEMLPQGTVVETVPTLLVTREIHEHANVFHTMTDLLNVYISITMMGWEEAACQVVLLDDHPAAPFDSLWRTVVAGDGLEKSHKDHRGSVRRLNELATSTLLEDAVFVPPGYSSLLYAHLYEANSCPHSTALFRGFRQWMHQHLNLQYHSKPQKRVTIISRRPKKSASGGAARGVVRGISNEPEILHELQQIPGTNAQLVDLSELELSQQLELIINTDILIGMHGAALAWSLLMQEGTALVELWPKTDGIWRCYEHTAEWAGLDYRKWANPHPWRNKRKGKGDATEVDVSALRSLVEGLL